MSYAGVGIAQDPVEAGELAKKNPIMSTASVMASEIMLRMSALPRGKREDEMVAILDGASPGMGKATLSTFRRLTAKYPTNRRDQAMFDAIRLQIADALVDRTLAKAGMSGLGQTLAEARGRTSTAVNDANALFCSYGAGTAALVGGFIDSFRSSGSTTGLISAGATTGAQIAGCRTGALVAQQQHAEEMARIAQSGGAMSITAAAQAEAARERRLMTYALVGGGSLVALAMLWKFVK